MADRENVIKNLEICASGCCEGCTYRQLSSLNVACWNKNKLIMDAFTLLKEQDERGKAICKEIGDFIRGSCSTDTDSDKEYACTVVNHIFIKGWR